MVIAEKFMELCSSLSENPTEELWKEFAAKLEESGIKHYSVSYTEGKVDSEQDLTVSKAILFDSEGKEVTKVPIYLKENDHVKGALIYLKGLTRMGGGVIH